MRFLNPYWLLLGLLAIPILILYMLKLRRREAPVSSTLLWQMLLRDRQANAPWQRLKRNLLLFLQLLILAGIVLALARPALPVQRVVTGSIIVLLDGSASMQATDVEPNRFEAAKADVRRLIDRLKQGAWMTIILVGNEPQLLASNEFDRSRLRQALIDARPASGEANWEAAFSLAAGASGESGEDSRMVILSDGGLPAEGLPPLPVEVNYLPVGESEQNLAISALSVRSASGGPQMFVKVTNYGDQQQTALLSFYFNNQLVEAQEITLNAGESLPIVQSGLSQQPGVYAARLSAPDASQAALDQLPLDDAAYSIYQPTSVRRALLATANPGGNLFLEQVLAASPDLTPFRALRGEDGAVELSEEAFDLYVLEDYFPDDMPPGNLLLVNPPTNPLFSVGGVFTGTTGIQVADHPLTAFVDWDEVHVLQARQVDLPTWAQVLVRVEGGPLVFAGETEGQRVAVLTFDLLDSDLPLQVAYPILFANLIRYLVPSHPFEVPEGLQPGDTLTIGSIPLIEGEPVETVAIASPSGQVYSYPVRPEGIHFTETEELGVYMVNYLGETQQSTDAFAVNLFSTQESDIAPSSQIQVGRQPIQPAAENQVGLLEFWPWLAALALVVLLVEWWVYQGRSARSLLGRRFE